VKPQERQITSCLKRAGQHARPTYKHCKACAKHAHAPYTRTCIGLHGFHLVEFSHQPVLFQVKQQVETPTRRTKLQVHNKNISSYFYNMYIVCGVHTLPPHPHHLPSQQGLSSLIISLVCFGSQFHFFLPCQSLWRWFHFKF